MVVNSSCYIFLFNSEKKVVHFLDFKNFGKYND